MLSIRRIQKDEIDAVKHLNRLVLDDDRGYLSGPWDDDLEEIHARYIAPGGEFLVATHGDRVVAMGALLPTGEGVAEIKRIRVHPTRQRAGIAQRLLRRLERFALTNSYLTLELDTLAKQSKAVALFEKNGYARYGESEFEGSRQILYRKSL